jgi:HEAT repeat protein
VVSLDALSQTLEDDEQPVRIAAAFAIQELAPTEESHTAVLIEAMKMGEGGVIVAVGEYGPSAAWAVPTLVSLLQDRRPGIRRITADALRQIGSAAAAAKDALRQAAQSDEDDRVRDAAQEALRAIEGPQEAHI